MNKYNTVNTNFKINDSVITLRNETVSDYKAVENVTREAFWNHHGPGCDEHYLMHIMREADAFIPELDFVAEVDGQIVGNIVYTKAKILDDQDVAHSVISFGPISVLPEYQGMGIGGVLIEHTKRIAKDMGYSAILIYGDPNYYEKFGFVKAEQFDVGTPDNEYAEPLQACELFPGALKNISGRFYEDEAFHMDENDAKAFDKLFPQKAMAEGSPSQIRFRELVGSRKARGPRNKKL